MTWVAVGMNLFDAPRVRHAAQLLAKTRMVTDAAARPVVVAMLVRLDVHLLNMGDVGDLGTMTDVELVAVAWPDVLDSSSKRLGAVDKVGADLRGVFRQAGLIDENGTTLVDFEVRTKALLAKRERNRRARGVMDGTASPALKSPRPRASISPLGSKPSSGSWESAAASMNLQVLSHPTGLDPIREGHTQKERHPHGKGEEPRGEGKPIRQNATPQDADRERIREGRPGCGGRDCMDEFCCEDGLYNRQLQQGCP